LKVAIHIVRKDSSIKHQRRIIAWIKEIAAREQVALDEINIILSSDKELLELNKKFLNHDYFTDIITFDNTLGDKRIGDVYISLDRVEENAGIFGVTFENELLRVMAHGVMHLGGYEDHTGKQKKEMRKKENEALKDF
jgi:probable rRNA maturation factor